MHAVALWLSFVEFKEDLKDGDAALMEHQEKEREKNLHLVMGELLLVIPYVLSDSSNIILTMGNWEYCISQNVNYSQYFWS